jgi:hypothetical protein
VLFAFSAPVDLTSVALDEIADDTDASYKPGYIAGLDASQMTYPADISGFSWMHDNGNNDRTVTRPNSSSRHRRSRLKVSIRRPVFFSPRCSRCWTDICLAP